MDNSLLTFRFVFDYIKYSNQICQSMSMVIKLGRFSHCLLKKACFIQGVDLFLLVFFMVMDSLFSSLSRAILFASKSV